uniref:Uncharacterized protein n=1 Tax=Trichuris muris TaxID=70415 RepID=A0A5S6Q1H0_TRIMR
MVHDGDVTRPGAGRTFLYEGAPGSTGQVGAEQGSNFRIFMEPWVYVNGSLFPRIRDEQQLCGWIAETPA